MRARDLEPLAVGANPHVVDARRIDGDCAPAQRDLPRAAPAIANDQGMAVEIALGNVGV